MKAKVQLKNEGASLYCSESEEFRCTHLGIGAHADDLEIMAYHGIAECYQNSEFTFSGVTVTNGVGSPQNPENKLDLETLRRTRQKEQIEAAKIGKYGFVAQLDYYSADLSGDKEEQIVAEIYELLLNARPKVVYLHQPGDKHPTHLSVLNVSMKALQRLSLEERPDCVYGCEVWRDLDWLADDKKIYLPTNYNHDLAMELISVFESQIRAGVAYDKGAIGRRLANGTFADPHVVINGNSFSLAIDLLPVMRGELTLKEMILGEIQEFYQDVERLWGNE